MTKQVQTRVRLFFVALFALLSLSSLLVTVPIRAAINPQINFQGKLTNPDGTNVSNGTYTIVFSLYSVASGGSNIWTETQPSVSVTEGIFQVSLGSVTSLPGSVDFNSSSIYLGIKVGADAEMTPRIRFTASPYAFNSEKLGGVSSTGFVQLGQSASAQVDGSTNSAIFINKTSTGNQVQLQSGGTDVLTISNSGNLTFGQNSAKTISVAQTASNAAGQALTIIAGDGGAGASANTGGLLALQGGDGGGTNGNGGDIVLSAGAGNGSGAVGSVIVRNPSNSTTAFQVQNTAGTTTVFSVDTSNDLVNIAGGLVINTNDNSVVRTTTADFALGTVGSDITNSNNQLELADGVIPNSGKGTITTAGQPATSAAIGAGALGITRADGKYLIIRGGTTGMDVFDSVAGTFTNATQTLNNAAGAGALALPRADGRYRIIHGGGATTTSLVDPLNIVAVGASVAVNASNAGTVAGKRPDGRFVFTNGGAATTQIYDPVADTFATGPSLTTGTSALGSLTLPRPDGLILFVVGGATGNTQLYNPTSAAGNIGVFTAGPTMGTGCEINGAGSVALRRADGKYVILSKANASTVYDPVANTFNCSTTNGPAAALGNGAHAVPLQDGKFLVIRGGATTDSYIYDPAANTFTAQGTALTSVSTGAFSLMRHDGDWQIMVGAATTTNRYDTGLPMTGTTARYTSDDISTNSLNTSSSLKWSAQNEAVYSGTRTGSPNTAFSTVQFFVRTATNGGSCTTALNAASDKELSSSGDFIRPTSTDNCIRISVQFNRPLPKRIIDERNTWTGNGTTVLRLDYVTPTLYDVSIENSTFVHRDAFNFSAPAAGVPNPQGETSGPTATRLESVNGQLQLPYGRLPASSGLIGTTGYYSGAVSGAHPTLTQAQTNDGTIVIARPNKTFVVIAALSTPAANASLYDPATQTYTAQSGGSIPTAANGAGGFALRRPDGKYLVVLGNTSTTTNIYDPDANTFSAGPALSANAGNGAFALPNADGSFTIVHGGGATTTTMYDPVRNTSGTLSAGPASPTTAFNCGALAVPRTGNNQYLVFFGAASGVIGPTTTSYYDGQSKAFSVTGSAPTLTAAQAVGCGAFAFQRQDGIWVIIEGGGGTAGATQTATMLYSSAGTQLATGFALPTGTLRGGHVIPRADGTFLIVNGNATTASQLYIPSGGTAAATIGVPTGSFVTGGPTLASAVGAGAVSFQRPDGKWVIINGNATQTTQLYDAGWYGDGQYLSEQSQVPSLAANSALNWRQTADNYVRLEARAAASQAALATTPYSSVNKPGMSIGNAGGETWVQIEVNMRRDFPTYGGALTGVYVSTGGMAYAYRTISLPTLTQYSLNNGSDLLTLQNDGLNVVRVTSEGNVYTSPTGGFYSGGADLAENYTSSEALLPGDVVVMDTANNHGVKRSVSQYQETILGVVSTEPGFVAGAYTADSFPVALVGRVPVHISNENGEVREGDFLTASSIPGYAMKATVGGRVLGTALERYDTSKAITCPAQGMGTLAKTTCGSVMMFVNLTDYQGASIDALLSQDADGNYLGNAYIQNVDFDDIEGLVGSKQNTILAFLMDLRSRQTSGDSPVGSDILTNRVNAVQEVISPVIVADIIRANKIQASSIEGLEVYTNKIARLSSSDTSLQQQNTSSATALDKVSFGQSQFTVGLVSLGVIEANGGIIINGSAQFNGKATFATLAEFLGDASIAGRLTLNSDSGGIAVIKKDANRVEVIFGKEYAQVPIISASQYVAEVTLDDGTKEDKALTEQRILTSGYQYIVSNVSTKGFSIILNKNALEDVSFNWSAVSVKDAKTALGTPQ